MTTDTQFTEAEERVLESYDGLLHAIVALADATDAENAAQETAFNVADEAGLTGTREGVERAIELLGVAADRGDFGERTEYVRDRIAEIQQYSAAIIEALEQAIQDDTTAAFNGAPVV